MSTAYGRYIPDLVYGFDPQSGKQRGSKENITIGNSVGTTQNYYEFNGSSSIIRFPSVTLTEWTVAYWFYDTSTGTNYNMTFGQNGGTNNRFYHRDDTTSYRLRVHNNAGVSVGDLVMANRRGAWTFLAYSLKPGTRKTWLQGSPVANVAETDSSEMIFDCIGNPYTGSSFHWLGYIGPAYLYSRQLEDTEVSDLYDLNASRFGL